MLRTVSAIRYVTPLREGGSLPAIVEGEDQGLYVMKFRGAGQGVRALIAEILGAALARGLGLRVPELVFLTLDAALGRNEPDSEIRELLTRSVGLNVGLDYLPGSLPFDPVVATAKGLAPDPELASDLVWFDAFLTNVDRTAKNPNLLVWHRNLWLIDHGAALYFHHSWEQFLEKARTPFAPIRDHVLLPFASALETAQARLSAKLTPGLLESAVAEIPDAWLGAGPDVPFQSAAEHRAAYLAFLQARLAAAPIFAQEALRARAQLL